MFPLLLVVAAGWGVPRAAPPPGPEERALGYLTREVPRWAKENRCYSCHHNGDAARALYEATRRGKFVPREALADTIRWLERPAGWDRNDREAPFRDKRMARLQFAASLAEAHEAGLTRDKPALLQAARLVVDLQDKDGSWHVEDPLGSPTTHGTALDTHLARRVLQAADAKGYQGALAKSDAWLRKVPVDSVLDAAAVLLALGKAGDPEAVRQKRRCLELVRKGEAPRGGWGPYVNSSPEVFDTALVLLALAADRSEGKEEKKGWAMRGRAYLLATQEPDGSWPETTRPPGSVSYAQRLSTTGWATLALLALQGEAR